MTGRHVAPRTLRSRRGLGVLAIVRRGSRSGRLTALIFALIAATATAYLVATPRIQDSAYDRALTDELRSATPLERNLTLTLSPQDHGFTFSGELNDEPGPGVSAPFGQIDYATQAALGEDRDLLLPPLVSAQTDAFAVTPETGKVTGDPPQTVVRVQDQYDSRVRWVAGQAPGKPTLIRILETTQMTQEVRRRVHVMPVGVSDKVAKALGVTVGGVYHLAPVADGSKPDTGQRDPVFVTVSGIFEPRDPTDPFWAHEPRMLDVAAIPAAQGGIVRQGAMILPVASYAALSDSLRGGNSDTFQPVGDPLLTHTLSYGIRDHLIREDAVRLQQMMSGLDTSPDFARLADRPRLVTGIPGLVDQYHRSLSSTSVVTSFASAGITALAVVVLMLTALVAVAGRLREITLVTARGATKGQVLAMALTGPVLWGLAGVTVAAGACVLLIDGSTPWQSWVQVALLILAPAVAIAIVVLTHVRDTTTGHEGTTQLVRTARRIVAEVALVVVAVLAVITVRTRGETIAGGQADWYAALAPVLLAAAAAVVAFRLLPLPIKALARLAGRGRGYVGYLGLARSSRSSSTAALPLLALVVGASVLTVLGTVLVTIGQQRELSAYRSVGADVRVDGARIDPQDVSGLAARPGVSAVAAAYVEPGAQIAGAIVTTGKQAKTVTVIGVDPTAYGTVVAGTPIADATESAKATNGRIPVRLSGGGKVGEEIELVIRGQHVPATVTAVDPTLARIDRGREVTTAFVPLAPLQEKVPAAQPTAAFVKVGAAGAAALVDLGGSDRAGLGELVRGVESARAIADASAGRALPEFVQSTYAVAGALASVLTFLAVVLLLFAGRPERRALLLRLRTMGMPRRAEVRLLAVEVLPLLLVAVLVGVAVGVAAPVLLSRAIDLGAYTVGPRPELTPQWWVAGVAAVAALLLAVLALVVEEIRTRRASLAAHLRGGENS